MMETHNKEAVEKHHSKMNVKFDWITELTMAKK
jgi:hypothetical protein